MSGNGAVKNLQRALRGPLRDEDPPAPPPALYTSQEVKKELFVSRRGLQLRADYYGTLMHLVDAGFQLAELTAENYTIYQIRRAGCTFAQMMNIGMSLEDLETLGYSVTSLIDSGVFPLVYTCTYADTRHAHKKCTYICTYAHVHGEFPLGCAWGHRHILMPPAKASADASL